MRRRGFTLLEILAAMMIVLILAGVVALVASRFTDTLADRDASSNLDRVVLAQRVWASKNFSWADGTVSLPVGRGISLTNGVSTGPRVVSIGQEEGVRLGLAVLSSSGTCIAKYLDDPLTSRLETWVDLDDSLPCSGQAALLAGASLVIDVGTTVPVTTTVATTVAPPVTTVPPTVPGAPTAVSATVAATTATVTFTPGPENGSPVTGFTVTCVSGNGGTTRSATGPGSPIGVPDLSTPVSSANPITYTCTVVATNAVGDSVPSAPSNSIAPYTVPLAPGALTASPGTGVDYDKVTVSWTAPSDRGAVVTSYGLELSTSASFAGASTVANVSSPTTLTGLAGNTLYYVRVRATNLAGPGAWASTSALTVPAAPTLTVSCPQGYNASNVLVNALTNGCSVTTSTASGATIDGVVAGPGGYSRTFTSASYTATGVPLANSVDSPMLFNARLCNASGCGPFPELFGLARSAVPQPGVPTVTKGACAFGYCLVDIVAAHAWTYEVNLWGGPSTGVLRCYDVVCSGDGTGTWPVGFDGSRYYSEKPNQTSNTRTFHVQDSCGGLGGCTRTLMIPQGTWIRVAGTNGFRAGAPAGWPNSGWCVPPNVSTEPATATCNWTTGPGVADYRGGYIYIN